MINPFWLYFGFDGRIGRVVYWIGLIVLLAISPLSAGAILTTDPFAEALSTIRALGWVGAAWTLALLIPLAALNTKRLHDLGQTGLLAVLFYAPAAIATIKLFLGPSALMADIAQYADWIAAFAGAAGLWFVFRLGFFPGTNGANKYGASRGPRRQPAGHAVRA
ncbi:MAG: DUF805 domain-containing protein [Pseudomonadota bacterium]